MGFLVPGTNVRVEFTYRLSCRFLLTGLPNHSNLLLLLLLSARGCVSSSASSPDIGNEPFGSRNVLDVFVPKLSH